MSDRGCSHLDAVESIKQPQRRELPDEPPEIFAFGENKNVYRVTVYAF